MPPTTTLPWRALNFSTSINIMTRRMQKLSFEADLNSTTILKHAINKLPYSKEFKRNQMETRQTDLCCEKKLNLPKLIENISSSLTCQYANSGLYQEAPVKNSNFETPSLIIDHRDAIQWLEKE